MIGEDTKASKRRGATSMRATAIESNPLVDVAAHLFLEDIADKQGAAGMNTYLMSLATSLARSMPEEEYDTWEDFLDALRAGDSILSTFETIFTPTDHCVVTTVNPFERGWLEYTKRIGKYSRIHYDVAEYYNATVKPGAIDTTCIIHQTFRNAAAERIRVGGRRVKCAQIATIHSDGTKKVAPDEWLPILLEKAGITRTQLNMFMRNNAIIWCIYPE
ncbi:MAG: hypothetical protein J7L61_04705 [Thermoplasmata archaeon]|nr:hypothetical protein [Thermoplasmata archaeon]